MRVIVRVGASVRGVQCPPNPLKTTKGIIRPHHPRRPANCFRLRRFRIRQTAVITSNDTIYTIIMRARSASNIKGNKGSKTSSSVPRGWKTRRRDRQMLYTPSKSPLASFWTSFIYRTRRFCHSAQIITAMVILIKCELTKLVKVIAIMMLVIVVKVVSYSRGKDRNRPSFA